MAQTLPATIPPLFQRFIAQKVWGHGRGEVDFLEGIHRRGYLQLTVNSQQRIIGVSRPHTEVLKGHVVSGDLHG